MFLLNKVSTARRTSREQSLEDCTETDDNMDCMLMAFPEPPRRDRTPRTGKQSRLRVSFFGTGARRRSLDIPAEDHSDNPRTPSSQTFTEGSGELSPSIYTRRRKLRKMSSKSSMASLASFSTSSFSETSNEGKPKSRLSEALFRAGPWAPPTQQVQTTRPPKQSISSPYNFTHLTQVNPLEASRLGYREEMGMEWNNVLRRESQSRPATAQTYMPSHSRGDSVATFDTVRSPNRSRSNSTTSLSRPESSGDTNPISPRESVYACPMTPPLRSSSRLCLRIAEHPEEETPAESQVNESDDNKTGDCATEEETSRTADDTAVGEVVSTLDDSCFGQKSPGIEKHFSLGLRPGGGSEGSKVPAIRETQPTPDLTEAAEDDTVCVPQMYLSVRLRPMSQLSHVSDTLSGNFYIPPSPTVGHGHRLSRRFSHRLSTQMRSHGGDDAAIDSWEQDIDWCYEHEVEEDCDFDWEKFSSNTESSPGDQEVVTPPSPPPPPPPPQCSLSPPMAPLEASTPKSELLGIPEEPKEDPVVTEKSERRITGIFEDRLLLPPSPRFAPSSFGFPGSQRARDSGFESIQSNDHTLLMRVGSTSTRHRPISSSPSLPDLAPGCTYREELCRVAKQLDEHIAALNQDSYCPPPAQTPSTFHRRGSSIKDTFTHTRADSQTTCVTLCSDTDTITPIETHEIITPSGSAHNSFQFMKQRSASVTGAGYAVEGRLEKGLSFAAAAIPGVVEVGPDGVCREEVEFVHYI